MSKQAFVAEVEWTEKERGWGQRPDGFTYYPSIEKAKAAIEKYWDKMPKDEVPECYSAPSEPKYVEVDPVFALLVEGKGVVGTDKSCKISNKR